jgi:CheY-like chemotaxis protein
MSDSVTVSAERRPTVYFIDDSATMREVIKMAFRRESINVIACHDAASALSMFGENAPDAVITDVIMPEKDGYEVCKAIKENPGLRKTPVILMSGVVNRTVAEKAIAVQADELIRKPFQPQELVARVKNLLNPKPPTALAADPSTAESLLQPSAALAGIFAAAPASVSATPPKLPSAAASGVGTPAAPARRIPTAGQPAAAACADGGASASVAAEIQKLRNEIRRLEMLVKKLQSDLQAEREYVASLEQHLKTLQEAN